MKMLPAAALRRGFTKTRTSRSGSLLRISAEIKAAKATTAIAKPAFDLNEPQPQIGDSITVKTRAPTAIIDNMKPGRSMRCGFSSRDFGIRNFPATNAMATMGMLTKNTEPHQ